MNQRPVPQVHQHVLQVPIPNPGDPAAHAGRREGRRVPPPHREKGVGGTRRRRERPTRRGRRTDIRSVGMAGGIRTATVPSGPASLPAHRRRPRVRGYPPQVRQYERGVVPRAPRHGHEEIRVAVCRLGTVPGAHEACSTPVHASLGIDDAARVLSVLSSSSPSLSLPLSGVLVLGGRLRADPELVLLHAVVTVLGRAAHGFEHRRGSADEFQ